jgi:mono/diheme cytochrome c family protein
MDKQQAAAPQACAPLAAHIVPYIRGAAGVWRTTSLIFIVISIGIGNARAAGSYYTSAQATAGRTLFSHQCALCHGQNLQGKVGPALAGQQFLSVSQYQKLTADYLYRFMAKQMPANAPGSLSKQQ